jgi:hypothetical protein
VCHSIGHFVDRRGGGFTEGIWSNEQEKEIFPIEKKYHLPINPEDRNLFTAFNARQVIGPEISSERMMSRNGVRKVIESISWRSKEASLNKSLSSVMGRRYRRLNSESFLVFEKN